MTTSEPAVHRILDAYAAAVAAKDTNALVSLYAPEVRVFDAWGTWSYEGASSWRGMVEEWFGSLGSERVRVDAEETRIIVGERLATLTAFLSYTALADDGKELRSMQNRLTWVLRPEANTWKIVHEHTSAPVGFDDMKAILKRPKGASPDRTAPKGVQK